MPRPCPITLQPLLEAKPWGGRRLAEFGIALPAGGPIGEALLTAPESIVASGPAAGTMLGELAASRPEYWVGDRGLSVTGGLRIFPLLVKLIDADADLSIQVHPGDRAAAAAGLGTGKTEAWHILAARPGAVLYLGLREGVSEFDFQRACQTGDGSAARLLRQIPAVAGMTIVVPAGTCHAIGAGILLYEIQQPSNVTFRLDDWGRLDRAGQPRSLHHQEGFATLSASLRPTPIDRVVLSAGGPERDLLAATRYFALERMAFEPAETHKLPRTASPQVLTCLEGAIRLMSADGEVQIGAGESAVVPVGQDERLVASRPSALLRGWAPDLERDVIGPAAAAGAANAAIEALGVNVGID